MNHHNKEIESMLLKDFDNDEIWAVYADWLQSNGDPRGTLIALEVKVAKLKGERTGGLNFEKNKEINIIQKNINDLYFNYGGYWVSNKSVVYPYYIANFSKLMFKNGFVTTINIDQRNSKDILINELIFLESLTEYNTDAPLYPVNMMPRLKSLSLRNCGLTEFPEFIKNHPSLEIVDLKGNPLPKSGFDFINFIPNIIEFKTDGFIWSRVESGAYNDYPEISVDFAVRKNINFNPQNS